jgi:hypothetical protein
MAARAMDWRITGRPNCRCVRNAEKRKEATMKTVMVRYKVKAEQAGENKRRIERVFQELQKSRPVGLRYASFRMPDGLSFVHISSVEREDEEHPLTGTPAFQEFVADIKARCDEPPVLVDLEPIGNYRLLGE